MIDKSVVKQLIDEIGDDGYNIFGNRFWLYFKMAAERYDGEKITIDEIDNLSVQVMKIAEEMRLDEIYS